MKKKIQGYIEKEINKSIHVKEQIMDVQELLDKIYQVSNLFIETLNHKRQILVVGNGVQ